MADMEQDDIDKLLADALGGDAGSFSFDDTDGGAQSQDEIDALIAAAGGGGADDLGSPAAESAEAEEEGGAQSQEDIDALIAAAGGGTPETTEAPAPDEEEEGGTVGQDDIDALIAANTGGDEEPAAEEEEEGGTVGQDDIDALIAANAGGDEEPAEDTEEEGVVGQDDIDALIAANAGDGEEKQDDQSGIADQDDIDALIAANAGGDEEEEGGTVDQDDIDAMLAANAPDKEETPADFDEKGDVGQDDIDAMLAAAEDADADTGMVEAPAEEESVSADDIDAMLAASEDEGKEEAATGQPEATQQTYASPETPQFSQPSYSPEPPRTPLTPKSAVPDLSDEQINNIRESLSLNGSSGEVESLAGQMSGLLGQLSERTRKFQAAWLAADQEVRELRHHITLSEQKVHSLGGERQSLLGEISSLRKQLSQIEGEKLASAESHRTELASLELKLREQESRNNMLQSEVQALKEELERARNNSTGSDLESRRARFELERVQGELTAEKQERQRLARALDNREKELQAIQAQSAGHASTLFLDELHRLVRRLESELDTRTSAAHEALSVVDRMDFAPEQQMYAATLRAAVATASGLSPDEHDALKNLDKQTEFSSEPLETPENPGEDSFVKAVERYDFTRASALASAQMRSGQKTPLDFMKELHPLGAIRRPEISNHLDGLAALLRGLKSLQEAADRARGKEGDVTEKLFVMMFDLLHSLIRLKLLSRATPAPWDLFLELRGRFSFLTSDRQWSDYRERILSGQKVSA